MTEMAVVPNVVLSRHRCEYSEVDEYDGHHIITQ